MYRNRKLCGTSRLTATTSTQFCRVNFARQPTHGLLVLNLTPTQKMEKRVVNPWQWQEKVGYAQAVEVKQVTGTLYCAGQAALDADGQASSADMKTQLMQVIENVEQVIREAGYDCRDIVRLNVYTTSAAELFTCFDIFTDWVNKHGMKQASTLLEVKGLAYDSLKVELEATVVK